MSASTGAAVVLVRHLRKSGRDSAVLAGGGSIAFTAAARVAPLVAKDKEDKDRRIVAVTKSNLGPIPPAVAYRLEDDPTHHVGRIKWLSDTIDATADDLVSAASDAGEPTPCLMPSVSWPTCLPGPVRSLTW